MRNMIKSMTGYGRGETSVSGRKYVVEVKTLNSRFCDVRTKLPFEFNALDLKIQSFVKNFIARGKVEVFVYRSEDTAPVLAAVLNLDLARQYIEAFERLKNELGIEGKIDLSMLAQLEGVVSAQNVVSQDVEQAWQELKSGIKSALDAVISMRKTEGKKLAEDLQSRLSRVGEARAQIEKLAQLMVEDYRKKLSERLKQFELGEVDKQRLELEVAIFADRSDITEELVRLESHISQFNEALNSDEPVGRRLDFLLQEMFREANTIAAKSVNAQISSLVVDIKTELEKMREQVQNIE